MLERARIASVADRERGAVRVQGRAGFLDPAVRMKEERGDGTDRLVALEGLDERRQPARLDECVRVEEAEIAAGSERGALIRGRRESDVFLVRDDPGADETLLEQRGRPVGGRVVHDDELERRVRVIDQRFDRAEGGLAASVRDHHDGHERLRDFRQSQGRQCRRRTAAMRRSGAV